jgi:hypothetical protein
MKQLIIDHHRAPCKNLDRDFKVRGLMSRKSNGRLMKEFCYSTSASKLIESPKIISEKERLVEGIWNMETLPSKARRQKPSVSRDFHKYRGKPS